MYRTLSLVLALIVDFTSPVHAQAEWPAAKPVSVIVPSSPGGGTDAYGRILGPDCEFGSTSSSSRRRCRNM